MKTIVLLILGLFFSETILVAQTQDWIWSRSAGEKDFDHSNCVATDAAGNIYITGYYHGVSIVIGSDTLFNAGTSYGDMFLARYDDQGNVVWAKSAGGVSDESGNSVATDPDGNIFIGGSYYSATMDFGSSVVINNLHAHSEVFIAKYDNTGKALWARSGNCDGNDYQYYVATDIYGNGYLTGSFFGTYLTFGNDTLFNTGSSDVYFVKFDPAGNIVWMRSLSGSNNENAHAIATDASGNVYLGGTFRDSIITIGSTTLVNTQSGKDDIFIVKYDNNGNPIWAKNAGGVSSDYASSIATDNFGNFYLTGFFSGPSATFGSVVLNGTNSGPDMFIAKYDSGGTVLWAKSGGGTSNDFANYVATDNAGNAYVTGWWVSPTITFGTTTITSKGGSDIMVLKYSGSGSLLWIKTPATKGSEYSYAIATAPSGSVYVTGSFNDSSITFGNTPALVNDSIGTLDFFLSKIDLITGNNEKNVDDNIFTLYPNPATQSFSFPRLSSISTLEIYNMLGEKVFSISSPEKKGGTIDISILPKGVYIVRIETKDKTYRIQFVKE